MDREDIRDLVIETTGRSDKTTLINSAINVALGKLSTDFLWEDLLTEGSGTMTASTGYVSLASDYKRLSEFRYMDGLQSYQLDIRPKKWVVKWYPDPSAFSEDKPVIGYLQEKKVFFVPYPDDAYNYSYSYYRLHPDLTADTDEILIRGGEEAIISYATYWTFKALEKHEDATQWRADYADLVKGLRRADVSPAVNHIADQRGMGTRVPGNFHLMPFVRRTP